MTTSKKALWLTVSKFATTAITMVITMLLSRFRTLEEYGTYSQINIITTVATAIFVMGLPSSVSYFLNKTEDKLEKQRFLSTYFSFGTFLGMGISLILVAVYPFVVSYFGNEALRTYQFAVLIFPWINIFNGSVENIYVSYNRIKLLIIYRLSYSIILLGLAAFFSWTNGSFYTYMWSFCILQAVFVLILYISIYFISGKISICIDKNVVKEMLIFSIPIGFSNVVSTLNIELDKLMVGRIFDVEQQAIYANMSKELPLNMLTISVTTILIPKIVLFIKNKQWEEAIRFWGVAIKLSAVIICFISTMLFVYSETVIDILYSAKYLPGNLIFKIYAITSLVKITSWGIMLNSSNNTKKILHASLLTLGCNFVLNLVLMKWIGLAGAAVATLASELVGVMIKLGYSSKVSGTPLKKIIPWFSVSKIFAVCVIVGILTSAISKLLNVWIANPFACSVISGTLAVLMYAVVVFKPAKKLWNEMNTY